MGLVKAVRLGLVASLSSRRRRDILDLRDCMVHDDISTVIHIDGKSNPVDVGTKTQSKTTEAQPLLEAAVKRGLYNPRPSDDHHKTFVNIVFRNDLLYNATYAL